MRKFLKSVFLVATKAFLFPGLAVSLQLRAADSPKEAAKPIALQSIKRDKPVDFSAEIMPLLKKSCLACHNASDAKGEFIMETPQSIVKGGDTGPAIVPGKARESLLMKLATHQDKPYMPPRNNKSSAPAWTPEELGLVELWINQGATGVVSAALGPINWQPLPAGLKAVGAVALSSDGLYAAASRANQIFIHNLSFGEVEGRLTDPELVSSGFSKGLGIADKDIIQSLAFSPDNRTLASGAYRSLKLWKKPAPQELLKLIPSAGGEVLCVSAAVDGKQIAAGYQDGSVQLWDLTTRKVAHEFRGHSAPVTAIQISPDGKLLATGAKDRSIILWDISNPARKQKLETTAEVNALAWAGSNAQLISGGSDSLLRIWEISFAPGAASLHMPAVINQLTLNHDGSKALVITPEGEGTIIDLQTQKAGKKLGLLPLVNFAAFSSNIVLTVSSNKTVASWNVDSNSKQWEINLTNNVASAAYDFPAATLALSYDSGGIELFQWTATGIASLKKLAGETKGLHSLAFAPGSAGLLYAATAEQQVKAYKTADGAEAFTIAAQPKINGLAVSKDGKLLATAQDDKNIRLWNAATGSAHSKASIGGFAAPVQAVVFSTDGITILGGSKSGEVIAFEIASGTQTQAFNDANGIIHKLQVGLTNQAISLAALNSVKLSPILSQRILRGHDAAVTAVKYFASTKQIISASNDGSVRQWNAETAKEIRKLDHGREVTDVAIRADGKRIASSGRNNNVKLWNAEDGKMIVEIRGDRDADIVQGQKERDLNFAKSEANYHKSTVDSAEKQEKAEGEALKKAAELKEKTQKDLTAKTEAQKKALEAKQAAEKAKTDLAASIADAKAKRAALEKTKADTTAQAAEAAAQLKKTQEELGKATADKGSLLKELLEVSFQARLATLQASEAREAAGKDAANKTLADAKAAADKLVTDKTAAAEALIDKAAAAKVLFVARTTEAATLSKKNDELQAASKTATETFANNEKIITSADQAAKDTEDKFKAAEKSFADADTAFKTAEGAYTGAIQGYDSTAAAQKKAAELIVLNKKNKETADAEVKKFEEIVETSKKAKTTAEKPFLSVAFSPDNKFLSAGTETGAIYIYTAETGKPIDRIASHETKAQALQFLTDGRLVSASADKALKIWNLQSDWKLARVIGDGGEKSPFIDRVIALAFSPDGKLLAAGGGFPSRSGEISIWNAADGSPFKKLKDPHSDAVFALEFSPDMTRLASGGADKYMRVFDLATEKQVKMFEGHTHHVLGVAWQRHGRTIASAGADRVVKVWDYDSGEQKKTIAGFSKEVTSIRYLDSTSDALVSSGDPQVKIIREDGGQVRGFSGSGDFVQAAAITPDGKLVAAGSMDGSLRIWNGTNGELIKAFEAPKAPEQPAQVAGTK